MEEILHQLNWFDYVIIATILFSAIRGFVRGIGAEIASLVMIIVVYFGGWKLYRPISSYVTQYTKLEGSIAELVGFFVAVTALGFIFKMFSSLVRNIVDLSFNDKLERLGGFLMGALKAGALAALAFLLIHISKNDTLNRAAFQESYIGQRYGHAIPQRYRSLSNQYQFLPKLPAEPEAEETSTNI